MYNKIYTMEYAIKHIYILFYIKPYRMNIEIPQRYISEEDGVKEM